MSDCSLPAVIARPLDAPLLPGVKAAAQAVRDRHGEQVAALLFYGSCLRDHCEEGRLIDFYVFTEDLRAFHGRLLPALLNAALPPNVYYIEAPFEGRKVRAKYAVMSLHQLRRATTRRAFHPTVWARLAQPCRLVFARTPDVDTYVRACLANAVITTCRQTAPLMEKAYTARDLWVRALSESYRTEFRSESENRAPGLYEADRTYYEALTNCLVETGVLPAVTGEPLRLKPFPARARWRARMLWRTRRWTGRGLQILRLAKAAMTFTNGLDYILFKIEQHSGVTADVTPWQKRHPLLAAPRLAWRLYRRGAFR